MLNKWIISILLVNQNGGNSDDTIYLETEDDARHKFWDKLSQLGGNPQTKAMHIEIKNPDGMMVKYEDVINPSINTES